MAIIFQLCRIFEVSPQEFGVRFWPGGKPLGTTMKTIYILASLVLALIYDRIENPPTKAANVKDLVKTLPSVELYKQSIPAI
ncbi:MAG: hypothetical protein PHX45_00105 [Acidobacteriota bacterium]|nr:hypothetical protein [Acidobacteriota bacterium]